MENTDMVAEPGTVVVVESLNQVPVDALAGVNVDDSLSSPSCFGTWISDVTVVARGMAWYVSGLEFGAVETRSGVL